MTADENTTTAHVTPDALSTYPLDTWASDGRFAIATHPMTGRISVVDPEDFKVIAKLHVGHNPNYTAITPDGTRAYVSVVGDGTVSQLDLRTGDVVRTIEVGGTIHGIDISQDGRTLYVAVVDAGQIAAVDLASSDIRRRQLAPTPYHLARVRPGKLYVSSATESQIRVVDAASLEPTGTIQFTGTGHQIAIPADQQP